MKILEWIGSKLLLSNEEMCALAGGGGKRGGQQVATPKPVTTTTSIGSELDPAAEMYDSDEEEGKRDAVKRAAKGTRGLRIPLTGKGGKMGSIVKRFGAQL